MIHSYLRTVILYLVLIAGMRLLGKRQIAQLEPSEFVLAMLIADLASIPMQNGGSPLLTGLVPILTVLGLELSLSGLTMANVKLRRILCGKPVILIDNGKILQENMRKARITLDELSGHLRQKDVLDIATVQFAILETDGTLSVFPYPEKLPAAAEDAQIPVPSRQIPLTIIEDGFLSRDNLRKARKDDIWLYRVLKERGADVEGTFLLTLEGGKVHWVAKEKRS